MNRFVVTINNPSPTLLGRIRLEKIGYLLVGDETAPTTGTHHFQIYVETTCRTFKQVQKLFKVQCHVESARGSLEQNQAYCKKERVAMEWGTPMDPSEYEEKKKEQGKRNDWVWVRDQLKLGRSVPDVINEIPRLVTCEKALYKLLDLVRGKPADEPKRVVFISGPPGTGKSRLARLFAPDVYSLPVNKNTRWWSGYNGEEDVLIEELAPDEIPRGQLLTWLDRYACRVQVSAGGHDIWLRAKNIYITTNHPRESFIDDAFQRRITFSIEFKSPES